MKKRLTALALSGLFLLSSCGDGKNYETAPAITAENNADTAYDNGGYAQEEAAEEYEADGEAEAVSYKQSEVKAIDTQMLVYSCDMSIDVLEFDDSVDKLHGLIEKYKGFIESETYSDGGNTSQWRYTDDQKWKTLTAVIRVPSSSYDDFCNDAENVGDMRRKNSAVQNLTTEYSDLKTTLSIYEAKEKRYIDLLSEIKNESEAVSVENELTQIQIEIARIKTRMNGIENDVAYSYINLTLNEVREYSAEPVIERTDTFGQRLKNTVTRTWSGFLEFLEGLLFLIIRLFPYLVVLGIFLFIVLKIRGAVKRAKASRRAAEPPTAVKVQEPTPEVKEEPAAETKGETEHKP